MNIQTKKNVGDFVYRISKDGVVCEKITKITIEITELKQIIITYFFDNDFCYENDLFENVDSLINAKQYEY